MLFPRGENSIRHRVDHFHTVGRQMEYHVRRKTDSGGKENMNKYLALFIVFGLFALGDYLGALTKAKLSSVFVALMAFLVLFITGVLPPDLIEQAGLTQISSVATAFLIFNAGTTVSVSEMIKHWKVFVMSILAMIVAIVSVLVVIPLIGKQAAIVSIPIVNGGLVATQIMTSAATEKGFPMAAALGTVVFAVQKFVGTLPASRCGLQESKLLVARYRESLAAGVDLLKEEELNEASDNAKAKRIPFHAKHEKYYTAYTTLGIAAAGAYLSSILQTLTGLSLSIWALLIGMLCSQLGIVPNGILEKGKSSGLWMVCTFCTLIPALANISISQLTELAFQTIVVFAAVLIGCFLFLYILPTWKLIGSRNKTMGIAMSQLLGFPATYLIVNEVATAVAETPSEKEYVVKELTPAFVVSGFVSVTSVSIIIAGIFAGLI